jgi:hydroxyethylthiazole kinase-like uncharacterized protein yjeF
MLGEGGRVMVICGSGNNGGDGFVAARHLFLRNVPVAVFLLGREEKLTPDAATNYTAARNCGVPVSVGDDIREAGLDYISGRFALIVDALLGTGVKGEVRDPYASAIGAINETGVPVVSVDVPSGLDCDTGRPLGVCVKAARTVTFILPKVGFSRTDGPKMCGEVTVADIGVPLPDDV